MRMVGKKRRQWLTVFVFALLISFIPAVKSDAAIYNYSLTLNGNWINGKIVEKEDVSIYTFTINQAGFVNIMYQGLSIRDSLIQIMDADQITEIKKGSVWGSSETSPETGNYTLALEAGQYCVKVKGDYCVGNYRLKGSFVAAGNTESEPNNIFSDATELFAGAKNQMKGFLSETDRIDIYKIQVPSAQKIKIMYTAGLISRCEIRNEDLVYLDESWLLRGATEEDPKTYTYSNEVKAGTYYIKITPYDSDDTGRYTLMWETEEQLVPVSSITIVGNTTMKPDTYQYLSTSINPANVTNPMVTWSSSDTSVATVDANGRVYARKAGKTIITALASDGSKVKKTVTLTVSDKKTSSVTPSTKRVTGIKISGNKKVAAGQKFKLKAVVSPSNATNKNVTWTSGNKKIATVSSKGVVTTKLPGKTTILAKAKDGSGVNKKITVVVLPKKMATPKVSSSNGKVRVSYGKQSGVSGYQVEGSLKKNFSNYQMNTVGKNKKAVTITGLAKGKNYYVRVRSYIKIGSKTYYGKWSSVKKVKVQ